MKRYIKDGIIKPRNQIVLHGTRTIKDKDGNEKEVKTQIINPREEMLLADGWVVYEEPQESEQQKEARIARRGLTTTDYKVIKCMEAYLCGEPLPYDIISVHAERQSLREIVNNSDE